ncbi:Trihelix transcription factor [Actinidia chinensis var. chinensis]|uniref:Trihelix transcription factor n=1 Tax=Actinidia chinensis var. chinensis TaxID=1590841 RepID=A0A2R6R0I6_ACTCC|nr:Trihelix transcription factor [Actinidia chinensis var. chinensis]
MEDDEEIQSHQSPDTGSPVSPPNGRITVTVAAAPPQNNTLTLALPIQQPRPAGNGGGGGGREDCWSEGATSVLIDAWGERYMELSRGNLKQKHWKEVADIVSSREDYTKPPKTDIQCKNRIDTVKKKYKVENSKIAAGGGPSKWPFFERLDHLIGPTAKTAGGSTSTPSLPSGGHKVPMGIPVGVRSVHEFQHHQKQQQQNQNQKQKQKKKQQLRRQAPIDSDSSGSESEPPTPDSIDSFPPETYVPKRPRMQREMNLSAVRPVMNQRSKDRAERDKNWGNSVRELTRAILKFGEAYEQAESSKLQQLVEMEKQRMKFAKELELQRMQFFMKTQLELSQLKHRRAGNSNHHNNNNNINNNNSDCSS